MQDPLPAVTEAEASGETAAIFADFRALLGVSMVNLIWRHLATIPGALPWAWAALRGLGRGTAVVDAAAMLGRPIFLRWLLDEVVDMARTALIPLALLVVAISAACVHWQGWPTIITVITAAAATFNAINRLRSFFRVNWGDKDLPARRAACEKLLDGRTRARQLQLGTTPMPASLRAALRRLVRHYEAVVRRDEGQLKTVERRWRGWQ